MILQARLRVSGANISVIDYLEAGDHYETKVYIETDGSDIPTEETYCHFALVRLGGLS